MNLSCLIAVTLLVAPHMMIDSGKPIDQTKGLFQTNQYSLYKIIIKRALTDPRRTDNPHEASAFLIPYDMVFVCIIIDML